MDNFNNPDFLSGRCLEMKISSQTIHIGDGIRVTFDSSLIGSCIIVRSRFFPDGKGLAARASSVNRAVLTSQTSMSRCGPCPKHRISGLADDAEEERDRE